MFQLEGSIGTVESILHSVIHVKFQSFERSKRMNSNVLEKKNKFSVGESVRVLNDEITLKEIEKEFGIVNIEEVDYFLRSFTHHYNKKII